MRIRKTSQYIEGGATLSNTYGTSQSDGYSQEYINGISDKLNGVELFSGNTANPTLSENYNNYKYLLITFQIANSNDFETRIIDTSFNLFSILIGTFNSYYSRYGFQCSEYSMSGKNITKSNSFYHYFKYDGTLSANSYQSNDINIRKVIGYK